MNLKLTMMVSCLLAATFGNVRTQAQARYDMSVVQRERLNRGVVALKAGDGSVYITWRTLSTDKKGEPFDIYRNGKKLNNRPLTHGGTFFTDHHPLAGEAVYEVKGGAVAGSFRLKPGDPAGYLSIPLNAPEGGVTPDGEAFTYEPNDASIGDVDGDGQYEIFLKWSPTNAHDNSHAGFTGHTFIDCYRLEGPRLWRIDLGRNIRSGAHYTQYMVYDFDGDGRAELMMKTADGTRDGQGDIIGDSTADYRTREGRAIGRTLAGPEYLTVFDGLTGRALKTVDYIPERGNTADWGDTYGNRCDRFLAGVAYLDGRHASAVFCRGYYTRTVIAAWDWDGHELTSRWVFDTAISPTLAPYAGQGNHNLRIADVDGDGKDEITYGSMAVDHDGKPLYSTEFGHGDAIHLVAEPKTGRLMIWDCHENKRDGVDYRDAATGKVVFRHPSTMDVGRCMAADIDPDNYGTELWSIADRNIYDEKGRPIAQFAGRRWSINFGIWWDGDLLRELLDHESVYKYNSKEHNLETIRHFDGTRFVNGTKSNPCLSADILGDWREEVLVRAADNSELRLYVSDVPTDHRINCLEEDIPYRLSVAAENVAYNQPPEPGFYIGPDDRNYLK